MRPSLRFLVLFLALIATPLAASAQLVVAGRGTNDTGVGLSGAQVLIGGTTIGTAAGNDAKVRYLPYPFSVRATNPNTPANPT